MADFNNAIMTTQGAALLAATTAGNARLKFLKLVTGSGSYTESEKTRGSLQARTSLKVQEQEFPFSSISMASDTCVKLVALVSNATLAAGYYVNEVGIYAKDELDENADPVLYSIAIANVADYLPPYNGLIPSTITQEYFATVDNALEVTIQTKVGAVALAEDLDILSKTVKDVLKQINNITENILGEKTGDAAEFESESVYKSGDYCLHNGILYKCVQDTEGEWNAESWKPTNTLEEIGAMQKKLEEVFCLCNENKQKLVENLIAMGVQASTSETWEDLLNKVLDMTNTSSDTVTAAVLLAGYTAHNASRELITGIIPELAATTVDATNVTQDNDYTYFEMPAGHYDENSKVRSQNSNLKNDTDYAQCIVSYAHTYNAYSRGVSNTYTNNKDIFEMTSSDRYFVVKILKNIKCTIRYINAQYTGNPAVQYRNGVQISADELRNITTLNALETIKCECLEEHDNYSVASLYIYVC